LSFFKSKISSLQISNTRAKTHNNFQLVFKQWGKPGAGAPNGNERRRGIGSLESPRYHEVPAEFGGKSLSLSDSTPRNNGLENPLYAKTIRHSNHTNLYDNPPPEMQSMIR